MLNKQKSLKCIYMQSGKNPLDLYLFLPVVGQFCHFRYVITVNLSGRKRPVDLWKRREDGLGEDGG